MNLGVKHWLFHQITRIPLHNFSKLTNSKTLEFEGSKHQIIFQIHICSGKGRPFYRYAQSWTVFLPLKIYNVCKYLISFSRILSKQYTRLFNVHLVVHTTSVTWKRVRGIFGGTILLRRNCRASYADPPIDVDVKIGTFAYLLHFFQYFFLPLLRKSIFGAWNQRFRDNFI